MSFWSKAWDAAKVIVPAAGSAYSVAKGASADKKSQTASDKAQQQAELEYNQRAPLRRQGMQMLGASEEPYDMKGLGYNASNPFAAARGPLPSNASYHDTGRFVTNPDVIDTALAGVTPEDLQAAQNAMGGAYIGKSDGKQRYLGGDGTTQFTNQDRERAQATLSRYNTQLGGSVSAHDFLTKRGVQPIRPIPSAPTGRPWGPITPINPLNGSGR